MSVAATAQPKLMSLRALTTFSLSGLALGVVLASITAVASSSGVWSDGLLWTLFMAAFAVVASILGFVFAVPRARAGVTVAETERYETNDNLVQISDWLTKLLVGVGLVELRGLPSGLERLGEFLGGGMAIATATAYSVAAVVYDSGLGFASGYLWTRLRFRPLLELSDREARRLSELVESVAADLRTAKAPGHDSEDAIAGAVSTAVRLVEKSGPAEHLPILWVDDRPENNVSIVNALTRLDIPVTIARTTEEALGLVDAGEFALIISDLGRVEGGVQQDMAGRDLLVALRERGITTPVIVFAGARGIRHRDELVAAGAQLVSQRASEVFEQAVRYATGLGVRAGRTK